MKIDLRIQLLKTVHRSHWSAAFMPLHHTFAVGRRSGVNAALRFGFMARTISEESNP
jgi:hypothetical protein